MKGIKDKRRAKRYSIQKRIRQRVKGTGERPRLSLYKSNSAVYVQLIDDERGHTLVSGSSRSLKGKSIAHAVQLAEDVAKRALAKNITQVVFDRSGYPYHGVVKAVSEVAREHGLKH